MSYKNEYNYTSIINYLRRSRKDEERERRTGEDTLSEQKALMTNVLDSMGIPYVQKMEIGSGDKISTRPVFQEVLDEIRMGKYDAIAVKEISRLGRGSYTDMGQIYDLITSRRIYIVTPYKTYDPTNDSDLRQIRFEMFLSREEFETIKTRLIGAKYTYAMQGKFMGTNQPYGFKLDKQKMILVQDEEKSKIVRFIYESYNNGINGRSKGFKGISNYLTKNGIKSPSGKQSWGMSVIKNILTNPVYKGEIHYRTTQMIDGKKVDRPEDDHIIVVDAHEAIISEEMWDLTQERIKKPNRKLALHDNHEEKELTGVVRCAACGYRMVTNKYTRKWTNRDGSISEKYTERLRCGTSVTESCGGLDYRQVEDALLTAMKEYANIDKGTYQKMYNQIFSTQKKEVVDIITININKEIKAWEKRREFVYDKLEDQVYSNEEFISRRDKIDAEIKKLKALGSTESPSKGSQTKKDEIPLKKFSETLVDAYNAYLVASKKQQYDICNDILRKVFNEVKVTILEKGNRSENAKFKIKVFFNKKCFKTHQ